MVVDPLAPQVVLNLGLVAIAGALGAMVARRLGQPTVVGFLAAGLLLGPVLGLIEIGRGLDALAEFGIALLLFLVGLEVSLSEARSVGPVVLAVGLVQVALSAAGGAGLAHLLGFTGAEALFLGLALAFSSTVVVVKILVDLGDLHTGYGRLAVGIFLVQDLVIVIVLTLLPVLGGAQGSLTVGTFLREAAIALGATVLLVASALGATRLGLSRAFRWSAGHPRPLLLTSLGWLSIVLAASALLEVSLEVGAFAAGVALATMPYSEEIRRRVHPILDLFIALFFVSLGARFAPGSALTLLPAALALSLFVLLAKGVLITVLLALLGYPRETSFRTGVTMAQVSEFSFVLAALAVSLDLIAPETRDLVLLVGMITIGVSAILINRSKRLFTKLAPHPVLGALPSGDRSIPQTHETPSNHVLLLGWDPIGAEIASTLEGHGTQVVVVAAHPDVPDRLPPGVLGLYADPFDMQAAAAAGLHEARLVVANLPEPGIVRILLEHTPEGPPVIARAETPPVARLLRREGAAATLSPPELVVDAVLERLREVNHPGAG